jgi:hypothetical protein
MIKVIKVFIGSVMITIHSVPTSVYTAMSAARAATAATQTTHIA